MCFQGVIFVYLVGYELSSQAIAGGYVQHLLQQMSDTSISLLSKTLQFFCVLSLPLELAKVAFFLDSAPILRFWPREDQRPEN